MLALCALAWIHGHGVALARAPFSIVLLPDTQNYVCEGCQFDPWPEVFVSQVQWIVDNRESLNVVYVDHLGDCVENGDTYLIEWQRATGAMYLLEDPTATGLPHGIPYSVDVGNHDQTPWGDPEGTTAYYNEFFGSAHFVGRPYYGGHFGDDNDNHYSLFEGEGVGFIVVSLGHDFRDPVQYQDVLAWADSLLAAHSDRWAVVSCHGLLGRGATPQFSVQGAAIYEALKHNPNLFLMVCGHENGAGRRADVYDGRTVHTLRSDYSLYFSEGAGFLRVLTFNPEEGTVEVRTYSPWLDSYKTDPDNQFLISWCSTGVAESPADPHVILHGGQPNPFVGAALVSYEIDSAARVTLDVYSASGALVRRLVDDEPRSSGLHDEVWDGRDDQGQAAASGVYFCRLAVDGAAATGKVLLLH
jgi:hypothetical protein